MSKSIRSRVITQEEAMGLRPVLRWIKKAAPRKRERVEAGGLLQELEGIGDKGFKQILMTKGQEEMLGFILGAYPVTELGPKQLGFPGGF